MSETTLRAVRRDVRALVLSILALSAVSPVAAAGLVPDELMIFYGWPGRGMGPCTGCFPEGDNAAFRAHEFGIYDDLVLGAGLELPTHPEHDLVVDMLAEPAMASTRVWGYVDAGVSTSNESVQTILARASGWQQMGAHGIFLDDFGYDFGTHRARQNAIVSGIHAMGMKVLVNAFDPDDAFSAAVDPAFNPLGAAPVLGPGDVYFYESHGVRLDVLEDVEAWTVKSSKLRDHRARYGFDVYSSTSKAVDSAAVYDERQFAAAWMLAAIAEHASTGYSEYAYSASGASNGAHVHRERPAVALGSAFAGGFVRSGDAIERRSDAGVLHVDLVRGTSTVYAATAAPSRTLPRLDAPSPNPFNPMTTIQFVVAPAESASIVVFDATGRRVREIFHGRGTGRPERRVWDGRDDRGRPLASGVYFVRLRQGTQVLSRKLSLAR